MKVREKSTKELVKELDRIGRRSRFWKSVTERLSKPRRNIHHVNLCRIEKYAKAKETVVVPGNVLGFGEIKKPVNIAALRFSKGAKEKIEGANGKCFSIQEIAEKNPHGSGIRILG